ncbi:MAG: ATP-dependent Clp protease adaptor ClpS [Bacteroidales bacterium]|jgi:ATP-dependent Clp protease adaptor protein ClpS|nr:ATP-dependent Clp protease adaptor ClpS [Bacteroidales bacterium]
MTERYKFEERRVGDAEVLYTLFLHNDDVNSFEDVISHLTSVCEIDAIQAEQIAYLVHYKGSCDVCSGSKEEMLKREYLLQEKGLTLSVKQKS